MNHIRKIYKEAEDIAQAMESGVDFDAIAPTMKTITADPKDDALGYEMQKMQYTEDHKLDRAAMAPGKTSTARTRPR